MFGQEVGMSHSWWTN